MLHDTQAQFPDNKMVPGRYLGPSIDVVSAMAAKIVISNGHVVPRLTLQGLTLTKRESPEHIELRRQFGVAIETKLGPEATTNDFGAIEDLIPEQEMYENNRGKSVCLTRLKSKSHQLQKQGEIM